MRIFLSIQHLGSFLVYEPVIRELAARDTTSTLPSVAPSLWAGRRPSLPSLADHPLISWTPPVAISDDVGVLVRTGKDDSSVGRLPPVFRFQLRRGAQAALRVPRNVCLQCWCD